MKTIYIFLLMTCMTIVSWAQSPGILGRRNLFMISTSTAIDHDWKPYTAPMISWERLRWRDMTYGLELEESQLTKFALRRDPIYSQTLSGGLTTRSFGIGVFFKNYLFKANRILPPMGPYLRYDFLLSNATSTFNPDPGPYVSSSSKAVIDWIVYPSISLSLGTCAMIKMRMALDFGVRLRLTSPLAIGILSHANPYSPAKKALPEIFYREIFKIYVGIGFLQ